MKSNGSSMINGRSIKPCCVSTVSKETSKGADNGFVAFCEKCYTAWRYDGTINTWKPEPLVLKD